MFKRLKVNFRVQFSFKVEIVCFSILDFKTKGTTASFCVQNILYRYHYDGTNGRSIKPRLYLNNFFSLTSLP